MGNIEKIGTVGDFLSLVAEKKENTVTENLATVREYLNSPQLQLDNPIVVLRMIVGWGDDDLYGFFVSLVGEGVVSYEKFRTYLRSALSDQK